MEQNQFTTEQIARVFAMYVYSADIQTDYGSIGSLIGAAHKKAFYRGVSDDGVFYDEEFFEDVKLLLKPLSSISDEDAIEVAKIILPLYFKTNSRHWKVSRDFSTTEYPYIKIHNPKKIHHVQIDCALCNFDVYGMEDEATSETDMRPAEVIQYLTSKGYAVPLFFAPGHPLNGKTAIEIGLAIDSTQSAQS